MKTRVLFGQILLFATVFFIFLLPPLLSANSARFIDFSSILTCLYAFFRAATAFFVVKIFFKPLNLETSNFFQNELEKKDNLQTLQSKKSSYKIKILMQISYISLTFGILCTIASILELIAYCTNYTEIQTEIIKPESFFSWIFCILSFLFSAAYEEFIYRVFLPESLICFFRRIKIKSKTIKIILYAIIESVCLFIFAFSHKYLGIFAIINASLAHIALRISLKKTKSVVIGIAAHFFYNAMSLIILL